MHANPQKHYEILLTRITNSTIKDTLRAHVDLELSGLPSETVRHVYFRHRRAYTVAKAFSVGAPDTN